MKIAIPVWEKSMSCNICESFGRTPYFLIYDMDAEKSEFIDNSAVASQGGAGIKAAQTIVDNKVNALLTMRCGKNAAEVFNAGNVKIYKVINNSIKDNIQAMKEEKLQILNEIHAGFHNHGGK